MDNPSRPLSEYFQRVYVCRVSGALFDLFDRAIQRLIEDFTAPH